MMNKVHQNSPGTLAMLAPAKLNLTLEIVGRRDDGYHLLESVMQSIDIADIVTVHTSEASAGSSGSEGSAEAVVEGGGGAGPNGMTMPNGEGNLAARAVAALRAAADGQHVVEDGTTSSFSPLNFHIDKGNRVAAGLGGGSADAAAALVAANELWGLLWDLDRLAEVGLRIGADVPFCVPGGTAIARGVGERLTPVDEVDTGRWAGVVLKPGFAVWEEEVYRLYSGGGLGERVGY